MSAQMPSLPNTSLLAKLSRWLLLLVVALVGLQLFFVLRVAIMIFIPPQSTSFQRSEAWRLMFAAKPWQQTWVGYDQISDHLKAAVIASEDADFTNHDGVEWEALEKAWEKNAKAEQKAAKIAEKLSKSKKRKKSPIEPDKVIESPPVPTPKIIGGSTISQQLAKNLLLSGERSFLRKGQEFVLTYTLELLLGKRRILEIYLNNVEWGEGVFGAEAASQRYSHKKAANLSPYEAARLAVMLPRPKYFEKIPNSGYLAHRANTIVARMPSAVIP